MQHWDKLLERLLHHHPWPKNITSQLMWSSLVTAVLNRRLDKITSRDPANLGLLILQGQIITKGSQPSSLFGLLGRWGATQLLRSFVPAYAFLLKESWFTEAGSQLTVFRSKGPTRKFCDLQSALGHSGEKDYFENWKCTRVEMNNTITKSSTD